MSSPTIRAIGIQDVDFGARVTIVEPSNLYGCRIGDDTFVGPFVEIQRGASVGRRCRVQSHSFLCDLVVIGDDSFIGHGVVFINDLLEDGPAHGDRSKYRPTVVGQRVSIGSNATILPVTISSDCVIGAGAVVTRDCVVPGVYVGNPARLIRTREP